MKVPSDAMIQANLRGIQFLQTELKLANTFLDICEDSSVPEHKEQSGRDAEAASRSILHLLPRPQMTAKELADFDRHIALLRTRLVAAGVTL
jgi:hypothetical protein